MKTRFFDDGLNVERMLMEINIGIIILDSQEEEVVFTNKAVTQILGDIIPLDSPEPLLALLLPESRFANLPPKCGPLRVEFRSKVLGYTIYKISEVHYCIFLSDITEKERLEATISAVHSSASLGDIFSAIRHELGNPVNSIKVTLSVLLRNIERFSEERIKEYVRRLSGEVTRLEELLHALKSFNMFEALDIEELPLEPFLEEFLDVMRDQLEERHVKVCTHWGEEVQEVWADRRALDQVLRNVITNALDAVEGRSRPEIIIQTRAFDSFMGIRITDNGCGISEAQKESLFQPFSTSKPHGTGLGLSITKKILASMGGTITISSQRNMGTSVTIFLPSRQVASTMSLDERAGTRGNRGYSPSLGPRWPGERLP